MSYLHCPTCACAYNVAREPACPRCGIRPGTPEDPTADVVAAAEQLARAMARATPSELAAAEAMLDARTAQLALPAPGAHVAPAPSLLRAIRSALAPAAEPAATPGYQALLTALAVALLARLAPPPRSGGWRMLPRAGLGPSVRGWAAQRLLAPVSRARALLARA